MNEFLQIVGAIALTLAGIGSITGIIMFVTRLMDYGDEITSLRARSGRLEDEVGSLRIKVDTVSAVLAGRAKAHE